MERLGDAIARIRPRLLARTGGLPPDPEPEPVCPRCKDRGWVRREVPLDDPDFGRALPCACRAEDVRDRLRRRSNLGPLRGLTFATFQPDGREPLPASARERLRLAFETCQNYGEAPIGWLVLAGPPGCGKTHLAAAIANRQIELGNEVFFAVVPDLLDHLRATFGPGNDVTYDELFEAVRNAPLLVLDDLGAQTSSPWAQEKLFQILNHRFNTELPTVVTTNLRYTDLDERLRARLMDRRVSRIDVRSQESPVVEALLQEWPPGLQRCTFGTFVVAESDAHLNRAFDLAARFAEHPEGWLVLVGGVGCGKTHLAAAIKNERALHGEPTLFMVVPELLDYLRQTYAPDSTVTYDRLFEAIRTAPVLVLDDYGAHSSTAWAEEKLFQLLNYRFNARLPTVLTTNLPLDRPGTLAPAQPQELRIASRLTDPGLSRVVRIDAPPYQRPNLAFRPPRQARSGRTD